MQKITSANLNNLCFKSDIKRFDKNGSKFEIEYDKKNRIIRAKKTGSDSFVKTYDYFNGKTSCPSSVTIEDEDKNSYSIDFAQLKYSVRLKNERIFSVLKDASCYTLEQLKVFAQFRNINKDTKNRLIKLIKDIEASFASFNTLDDIDPYRPYFAPFYSNAKKRFPTYTNNFDKNSLEYKFFLENKDLDLTSDINLFEDFKDRPFDVPERFMIMADNSLRKTGNAYIIDEIPKIFQGVDINDVIDKISKFARLEKEASSWSFYSSGKKINAEYIGGGDVGIVYKLFDEEGNCAAIKIYSLPKSRQLNCNCAMTEIPTSIRLKKDNVGDVPKFYMANAALYGFNSKGEQFKDVPWMISEYIDNNTHFDINSRKLNDWLVEHNMHYVDFIANPRINAEYLVDLGGIIPNNITCTKTWGINGMSENSNPCSLASLLYQSLTKGFGVKEILETFEN